MHRLLKRLPQFQRLSKYRWQPLNYELNYLKQQSAKKETPLVILQIGANDGMTDDPIYDFIKKNNCFAIVVEPIKDIYSSLAENYRDSPNVVCENIAISKADGSQVFYSVDNSKDLPYYVTQLGSFSREIILKEKTNIPDIENYITEQIVECLSLDSLLRKHSIDLIDLLYIDTEGYDYEVIKQLDLTQIKPKLIHYEHIHLSENDKTACEQRLKHHKYCIRDASKRDSLAISNRSPGWLRAFLPN